jgi:hypothetical protein
MSNIFRFYRKKRFYIKFFAVLVSLTGLWGSIISFSPISLDSIGFLVSLLIIITISFISGIISVPKIAFPTDEVIPFELSSERKCKITFPCTLDQYKIANKIANDSFTKKDNLSFRKIKAWWEKNPLILSLYYDTNNKVMGYFDVLPLYSDFEKELREGILSEQDITCDSMKAPEEMYHSDIIYIGGIAVLDMDNKCRSYHAGLLLHALLLYLKTFYSFEKTTIICAIAATRCGEHLLDKLGFTIYKEGLFRNDGHNYYMKEVTLKDIKKLEKDFGKKDHRIDCSAYKIFENSEYGKQIIKQL